MCAGGDARAPGKFLRRENHSCLLSLVEREQFRERGLVVDIRIPTVGRGDGGVEACVRVGEPLGVGVVEGG